MVRGSSLCPHTGQRGFHPGSESQCLTPRKRQGRGTTVQTSRPVMQAYSRHAATAEHEPRRSRAPPRRLHTSTLLNLTGHASGHYNRLLLPATPARVHGKVRSETIKAAVDTLWPIAGVACAGRGSHLCRAELSFKAVSTFPHAPSHSTDWTEKGQHSAAAQHHGMPSSLQGPAASRGAKGDIGT